MVDGVGHIHKMKSGGRLFRATMESRIGFSNPLKLQESISRPHNLAKSSGLEPPRSDSVLLAATLEPPKRLTSEPEPNAWLDGIVSVYAQRSDNFLPAAGGWQCCCWRYHQ